ncbi:MAG: glycosyltransferase family 2 protein, partial [Planctomycetia bacterium]
MKTLVAIPVYNEEKSIAGVLRQTLPIAPEILVVDDGSTDATPQRLAEFPTVRVVRHEPNRGYGAALRTAFDYAARHGFECVVTMDSDGQHSPLLIPEFVEACRDADVVSGSRYIHEFAENTSAPIERRRINSLITDHLNARLGYNLTDAFCGFKAYRVSAVKTLDLTVDGYAMPLEFWVQTACRKLRVVERAVPRVYLDLTR